MTDPWRKHHCRWCVRGRYIEGRCEQCNDPQDQQATLATARPCVIRGTDLRALGVFMHVCVHFEPRELLHLDRQGRIDRLAHSMYVSTRAAYNLDSFDGFGDRLSRVHVFERGEISGSFDPQHRGGLEDESRTWFW